MICFSCVICVGAIWFLSCEQAASRGSSLLEAARSFVYSRSCCKAKDEVLEIAYQHLISDLIRGR